MLSAMRTLSLFLLFALLSSCKGNHSEYNGYIDADVTYLSSSFPGRLTELLIQRGQTVHDNQLLFKLEQTSELFERDMSQFNEKNLASQREALVDKLHYDDIHYQRVLRMQQQHVATQESLDIAKKNLAVLKNRLAAIDFQIKNSHTDTANKQWRITQKEGYANHSGIVFDTYFNKGEYVQAGQPVLSLITEQNIKVIFYVSETELSEVALNQKVQLSSDGSSHLATGIIRYISKIAQYTPPIIFSREQRSKLVFRVEASIDTPHLDTIHLGQPVSLELIR